MEMHGQICLMACWPVLCLLPHASVASILLQKKILCFFFFFHLLTVGLLFLGKGKHLELSPCVPLFVCYLLESLGKCLPEGSGRALVQQ